MGTKDYSSEWKQLIEISSSVKSLQDEAIRLKSEIGSLERRQASIVSAVDEDGFDPTIQMQRELSSKINASRDELNQVELQREHISAQARNMGLVFRQNLEEYKKKQKKHGNAASFFSALSTRTFGKNVASQAAVGTKQRSDFYGNHCAELEKLINAAELASNGQLITGTAVPLGQKGRLVFSIQKNDFEITIFNKSKSESSGRFLNRSNRQKNRTNNHVVNQSCYNNLGIALEELSNQQPNLTMVSHVRVSVEKDMPNLSLASDAVLAQQWSTLPEHIAQYRRDNNLMWIPGTGEQEALLIPQSIGKEYGYNVESDSVSIVDVEDNKYLSNSRVKINGKYYKTDDFGRIHMYRNYKGDYLPLPNLTYTVNGYTYRTDSLGRIIYADGILQSKEGRREALNSKVPGMCPGDQRGHIFGDHNVGSNHNDNLVAMLGELNQGDYKKWEMELTKLAEDSTVVASRNIIYNDSSFRPAAFVWTYSIDGRAPISLFFINEEL